MTLMILSYQNELGLSRQNGETRRNETRNDVKQRLQSETILEIDKHCRFLFKKKYWCDQAEN